METLIMDRLARILSIFMDLINHKVVDTSYLSEKYQVSTRTIYRDIELLDLAGIPIISKRGTNGGFSIIEGFKIDRNILSEEEFSILLRGLQTLIHFDDPTAQAVYDKLTTILANSKKEQVIQHSNHVIIDISPFEPQKQIATWYQLLHQAITQHKCVKMSYNSIEKGISQRIIEPIHLFFKTANWYLYAFCRNRNEYRYFKLARIKEIEILEEEMIKRETKFLELSQFFTNLEEIDLVLETSEDYSLIIEEHYFVTKKEIQKGKAFITLHYPLTNWVYDMILSFGNQVKVIHPQNVKNEIIKRIQQMNELYQK